ncbi:MAG: FixH family protein [Ramlibacter sp.]|nr:FixH family protein [Ramlibacter sp.]
MKQAHTMLLAAGAALTALSLTGCMTPPPTLDLALEHTTAQGRYVVTLVAPQETPAINQIHAWKVKVASPEGKPVTAAQIAVDGGMPQHGHGLPTQPLVRRQVAEGTYLIEGMKFSMTGWWEVKLALDAPQGPDKVTFNVVVADPVVARK